MLIFFLGFIFCISLANSLGAQAAKLAVIQLNLFFFHLHGAIGKTQRSLPKHSAITVGLFWEELCRQVMA